PMAWRCDDRMPALTPGVRPKSSGLTMSRRLTSASPRRGPLDREALDRLGYSRRHGGLQIVRTDVLEALVADARERLGLAADDGGSEARRFELGERGLRPEEREDREDQPAPRPAGPRRAGDHAIEQLTALRAAGGRCRPP